MFDRTYPLHAADSLPDRLLPPLLLHQVRQLPGLSRYGCGGADGSSSILCLIIAIVHRLPYTMTNNCMIMLVVKDKKPFHVPCHVLYQILYGMCACISLAKQRGRAGDCTRLAHHPYKSKLAHKTRHCTLLYYSG